MRRRVLGLLVALVAVGHEAHADPVRMPVDPKGTCSMARRVSQEPAAC